MKVFIRRILVGFAIGLSLGSAFAAAPNRAPANNSFRDGKPLTSREAVAGDGIYAETETFQVRSEQVEHVLGAMTNLGLSEDLDFAWMNKVPSARVLSFVCYSVDCHRWAKKQLHTISVAPARPEEKIGLQWRDPSIDHKKERALTEDEKIRARHTLRYSAKKEG